MIHVLMVHTAEGKICLNVDNEEDYAALMAQEGTRELSANEIRQYGIAGYEHLVCPDNTVCNDNGTITFTPPEPEQETPEQMQARYTQAAQDALDAFARTRNYDGILSACSYAGSTDAQFRLEGEYCLDLRDATWRRGYAVLAAVLAGTMELPTVAEFIAMLPVSEAQWPDESNSETETE